MTKFFPEGLAPSEFAELEQCAVRAAHMELSELLRGARDHVAETRRKAEANPLLDVQVAEALLASIEEIATAWDALPSHAQQWCRGMMLYFADCNQGGDDYDSPVGFDDDAEVVNACLRLAGRPDLCVNPEDFDGA